MAEISEHATGKLVAVDEVFAFVKRCMVKVGAAEAHAASQAELLVTADSRGHFSHGLNRLASYVQEVSSKLSDGSATPVIVKETPGTAFVDGRNGVGSVVGTFAMDLAIRKAKQNGVAWVTCTGSNHYGIAAYYSLRAVKQGLIGITVTNTSAVVVPTRAKNHAIGTNPLAFAAPGQGDDCFCLDMATSAVALGKVEMQKRKQEQLPAGWALDRDGRETLDPEDVYRGGGLQPLGGSELTSGYKGYGLGMMIEVMCGILSGGPFSHHIRRWDAKFDDCAVANLGQTFIALDPNCFAPGFEERMQSFMDEMRQMDPADPSLPVLVAGDPERVHMRKVKENGGIFYHHSLITAMDELSKQLDVEPMKTL